MDSRAGSDSLSRAASGVRLSLRVQPKASREGPVGRFGSTLRWAVSAPPEKGKANQRLIRSVACFFGVARSRVTIVSGKTGRNKILEIQGLTFEEAAALLDAVKLDDY